MYVYNMYMNVGMTIQYIYTLNTMSGPSRKKRSVRMTNSLLLMHIHLHHNGLHEQVHKAKDNYIGLLKFAANILPFVILNICICIDTHLLWPLYLPRGSPIKCHCACCTHAQGCRLVKQGRDRCSEIHYITIPCSNYSQSIQYSLFVSSPNPVSTQNAKSMAPLLKLVKEQRN